MASNRTKARKNDSEKTKEKLLTAAMDVISTKGYKAATTRQIAAKAQVNVALISRYFKSKEELFMTLLDRQLKEITDMDGDEDRDISHLGSEEFKATFTQLMIRVKKNEKILRILLLQSLTDPKYAKFLRENPVLQNDAAISLRFERIKKNGGFHSKFEADEFYHLIRPYLAGQVIFSRFILRQSYEQIIHEIGLFIDKIRTVIDPEDRNDRAD